jgi:hypothetical protein
MTLTRDTVLFALAMHTGEQNGVRASDLVAEICGDSSPGLERQLRHQIEELRRAGEHICGRPSTGYYLAANDDELQRTVAFLHDRAMTSLSQAAAMQRVSLPDLRGQLRIRLESTQAASRPPSPAGGDCNNTGSRSPAHTSTQGDPALSPERADA